MIIEKPSRPAMTPSYTSPISEHFEKIKFTDTYVFTVDEIVYTKGLLAVSCICHLLPGSITAYYRNKIRIMPK